MNFGRLRIVKSVFLANLWTTRIALALKGKTARDYLLTAGGNLGATLLGSIGGILAARLLGPEGRGELAAAVVWAGILAGIAQLGLPQALTFATAREPKTVGTVFSTTLVLWLIQSVLVVFAGWFAVAYLLGSTQPAAVSAVQTYLFSVPALLLTTYLSTIAQGLKRFDLFNSIRIVAAAGYVLALMAAGALGLDRASAIVVLLLVVQLVVALGSLVRFITQVHPAGRYSPKVARLLLGYGLKAYWGNLSWMANARIDQFVMSAFVGLSELGQYAVAVSYATVLFPLSSAFAMVLFPRVAEGDRSQAPSAISRTLRLNLVVSLIGGIVLALLAPVVLPWLFGTEFSPSVYPAVILLIGTVLLGSNYVLSDGLRGLGLPNTVSIAEVVGLLFTVAGLLLLLPVLGAPGAAYVSVLSYAVVFLMLLAQFKRQQRTSFRRPTEVVPPVLESHR